MANRKRYDYSAYAKYGPCRMHQAIPRVRVLAQVEGEELLVIGKAWLGRRLMAGTHRRELYRTLDTGSRIKNVAS